MYEESPNIYRKYRERAKMTREEAAFELGTSVTSLKLYETFDLDTGEGRLPPEDVVIRMGELYGDDTIEERHQNENTKIGRRRRIKLQTRNPAAAFLNFQAEKADVEALENEVRRIVIDDMITDAETELAIAFIKELEEFTASSWSLVYSLKPKNSIKREIIMNERRSMHDENERIFSAWR